MTRGQIAILPVSEGRRAERRIVNLAARLRDQGAVLKEIEILNLSTGGFLARGEVEFEHGAAVWLKLPGLEPQSCRVAWTEGEKIGFEFATPLHRATLDLLLEAARRPPGRPRRLFGTA